MHFVKMESCKINRMTQRSILLAVVILMTCSIGQSEGFFLKNLLPETITDETEISRTAPTPATLSADINPEIHRNFSENLQESSTQIVNSVKEIVTLVLDEHINQTQHKLPEESNQIDVDSRTISIDGDNDIPATQAALTNLDHLPNNQSIRIVKIPDADDKDIVTSLEDNIRNSVKDQQNFEQSAFDLIDGIPEPEVRQSLTEDLMAVEYPQSVRNSEETSGESKPSDAREADETFPTETILEATTVPTTTRADPKEEIPNPDSVDETTINVLETEIVSDVEVTTPTYNKDFQETTQMPIEEIVHSFEDLLDTKSIPEEKLVRTRQMRGFSEESDTNEVSPSKESSKDTQSSKSSIDSSDTQSSKSKSNDSSDPSTSSDSSSKEKFSSEDENIAAEDTSEESDDVISQDASIEENLDEERATTAEPIASVKVTRTPRPTTSSVTNIEQSKPEVRPSTKVTPTPRPATAFVTTAEPVEPETADPILIEEITESTGELLTDVSPITGEGKHVVMKKPGVEEELTSLNTSETRILEVVDPLPSEPVITEPLVEISPEIKSNKTSDDIPGIVEMTKPAIEIDSHKDNSITENLLETDDPLVHLESQDSTQTALPTNLESGITANLSSENASRALTEINDIQTEQVSISEPEKPLEMDQERKSNHTNGSINDEETQQTSSPAPTLQTDRILIDDQGDRLRTLDTDQDHIPSSENASKTLNAETVSVPQSPLDTRKDISNQTPSSEPLIPASEDVVETSTESPSIQDVDVPETSFSNAISKYADDAESSPQTVGKELQEHETSTERPSARSNEDSSGPALVNTLIEAAELTTEFARHVDSFRTTRDETAAISDEIVSPTAAGRSSNAIIAEGLGKPLPTRSVGDEPSSSSYSSEDKTTTVVVLCSSAAVIFVAFSIAIYLITFQRQHGTLDIEMQEQRCGKDNLEDEEDAETRVKLLNQFPQVDSDEHSSD